MVRGLDVFKKYFEAFPENYVIIGGTACDIVIEDAALIPRATKDIDIILIVEALSADFIKQFWKFIQDGNYERKEKSDDGRQYYRFMKPEDTTFPLQVELFSRMPDTIDLEDGAHLTPIPANDDLSSLSAILMDDDFYHFMIEHSTMEGDLHRANTEALICLKAKAYLEIADRIAKGSTEDKKQLKKHKADVFRLAVTMSGDESHDLPEAIKKQLISFTDGIKNELPDKVIFKEMGLGTVSTESVFDRLLTAFHLTD